MNKAKKILKQWLDFADGYNFDFKYAQAMAIEHCEQNNDYQNAQRIAKLELDDVFEGQLSNPIYQLIVALRTGKIKPFAPMFELDQEVIEFTHTEPCDSIDEESCEALWEYNEDTKEFELIGFKLICDDYTEHATNGQLDALRELLIEPKREEFSNEPDPDWYLDTI